jgi:hypothetical protein
MDSMALRSNKRLKLPARVDYGNESFFFSAPQLKRDPLGSTRGDRGRTGLLEAVYRSGPG